MNTYIYAGNSALLVVKDNDLNRDVAIIKSEELYNNFKRNLEYEKNRHNECCDKCSPSTC